MLQSSSSSCNNCSFVSSSSSTSTSSNSNSNSCSSSLTSNNNQPKTTPEAMEEVWKDITMNSLPNTPIHHIHNIHHPTPNSHFRGVILQDFLNENNPSSSSTTSNNMSPRESSSSQHSMIPPTIKPPTTEFQFFDNEIMNSEPPQFQGNSSSVPNFIGLNAGVAASAFDALASSSVLASFGGGADRNNATGAKKRLCDGDNNANGGVDRRHKRMIKNRESAARSRARKQAYITELELEIDQLAKENAMLRKQQRQLIEAPATMLPKKHGLHRTSTAPF